MYMTNGKQIFPDRALDFSSVFSFGLTVVLPPSSIIAHLCPPKTCCSFSTSKPFIAFVVSVAYVPTNVWSSAACK